MVSLLWGCGGGGWRSRKLQPLSAGSQPSWKERLGWAVSCSLEIYHSHPPSLPLTKSENSESSQSCQNPSPLSPYFRFSLRMNWGLAPKWRVENEKTSWEFVTQDGPRSEGTPDRYLKCCDHHTATPRLLEDNMKWLGCPHPLMRWGPGNAWARPRRRMKLPPGSPPLQSHVAGPQLSTPAALVWRPHVYQRMANLATHFDKEYIFDILDVTSCFHLWLSSATQGCCCLIDC